MSNWIRFDRNPRIAAFLDGVDIALCKHPEDREFGNHAYTAWAFISEDWGLNALNGDENEVFIAALNGESVPQDDIIDIASRVFGRHSIGAIQSLLDSINADHAARLGFAG